MRRITLRGLLVDCRPVKKARKKGPVRKDGVTSEGGFTRQLNAEDRYCGQTEYHRKRNYYKESQSSIIGQKSQHLHLCGYDCVTNNCSSVGESPNKSNIKSRTHLLLVTLPGKHVTIHHHADFLFSHEM
jgi:hypothetical protein